jgi:mRNA interferase MazF
MVKPVAGEIVAIPFPRDDGSEERQRPALVIADLPGADLILCQITSRAHWDAFAVPLDKSDCERGGVGQPCFIRPQRLFTVEQRICLRSVGKVTPEKFDEVFKKARALFVD